MCMMPFRGLSHRPLPTSLITFNMPHSVYTVEPHLNYMATIWQQSCIFLSLVIKFGEMYTQKFLCVQLIPSSSMHCSVPATGICIWRDIQCPLQYMSAGDALPLLNACAYLATIQYSRASSSASRSCAWHSHTFSTVGRHLVLHVAVHGTPIHSVQ
jgi:hypothetical protein